MPTGTARTYVFTDAPEEAARLLVQNDLLNRLLGKDPELSHYHAILDIACGSGGWVLDVARDFPQRMVVGIDRSPVMIEAAQRQALVEGQGQQALPNVRFQQMDVLGPLDFGDGTFDYVHGRLLSSFLAAADWAGVLLECLRLLRPGGAIRLIEAELPITTSPGFEQMSSLIARAYAASGKSVSGGERNIGITSALSRFLRAAGFLQVGYRPALLNFSAGEQEAYGMYQNVLVAFKLLQPFLLASGVASPADLDRLYGQTLAEMGSAEFDGVMLYLTAWGTKPGP